jgi:hypothetical protein
MENFTNVRTRVLMNEILHLGPHKEREISSHALFDKDMNTKIVTAMLLCLFGNLNEQKWKISLMFVRGFL